MEFTDRYQALRIPYPDPETICKGQCEGTGYVPVFLRLPEGYEGFAPWESEKDPVLIRLWEEAEAKEPTDDGYHFVICPDCNGTRLRNPEPDYHKEHKGDSASCTICNPVKEKDAGNDNT